MVGNETPEPNLRFPRPNLPQSPVEQDGDATGHLRTRTIGIGAAAVVVLAGVAAALFLLLGDGGGDAPEDAATAYLAAWEDDDLETMATLVDDPPESFSDEHESFRQAMAVEAASYSLTEVETENDDAIAHFEAVLTLAGLGEWSYDGRLRLRRTGEDGAWQVAWTAAAIHPDQQEGLRLALASEWPERGGITDMDGEPLVTEQPAVLVGIEPQRMEDRDELKDALEKHLDVDPERVDGALDAPGVEPDHLVPIVTIPRTQFEDVRAEIFPIPGLVFPDRTLRRGPTEEFAAHVIGRTGEITAERLEELGSPYQPGDTVGITGLEARFESELAGTPSGEIRLVDDTGGAEEVVETISGNEPVDIVTTIDPVIQLAVDEALADVGKPVAAVVVDADGNIRASASRPMDEYNRALTGAYPPGSTFKVVTTDGLLANGMTPDTDIDCEETIVAGGRQFKNFEDAQLGSVPFRTAFAESCNTAFIGAVEDLPASEMVTAAERFGFNTEYSVGLNTEAPTFPEPSDATEKAAAAIGQGRILATPLHMATVAAAVRKGTWQPPTLLPELPASDDAPEARDLDSDARSTLNELMELVVREGSGDAAAVPGATIAGKTGTAEFGSGDPPPTHAWFIGFRGDLALAVLVEDGGVGGRVAGPIAGEIFAAFPDG